MVTINHCMLYSSLHLLESQKNNDLDTTISIQKTKEGVPTGIYLK